MKSKQGGVGVVPKAVIAALVGTVCGVTAGVWSLRQPAAKVSSSASSVATPATAIATDNRLNSTSSAPAAAKTDETLRSASTEDDARVLQDARTLARRPDVAALMALRDDVVRRATERGIAESPAIKGELDAIDSSLNDARLLRLKLDAEELRRAESK